MRKKVRSYDMGGWHFDIYDDGSQRFMYIGKEKGDLIMTNEKIIEQLDEFMKLNRQCRQDGNDILNKVRGVLTKKNSDDYEKGLNDAWELAKKICMETFNGGYTMNELRTIFDTVSTAKILCDHTYHEALSKIQEYEKKKAEEAAMPVIGDVVKVIDNTCSHNVYYGVYLGVFDGRHYIIERDCCAPTCFTIKFFTIEKTGQHIDLEGWTLED